MPTTYTHYKFGKEVLSCLPYTHKKAAQSYRELFDIGLHGPDLLFYHILPNEINQLGKTMHKTPASVFFKHAAEVWETSDNKEALRSYLYGFICHFALDSVCHPYIEKITRSTNISHGEIEAELDRLFLLEDNIDPMEKAPTWHLHPSAFNSKVIASCMDDTISDKNILWCIRGMIFSLKMLHAPHPAKRKFMKTVLTISGNAKKVNGMIMMPEANPECDRYCVLLKKLYTEAVTVAASLIQNYANVLDHKAELSSRFDLTFSAGKHWKDLII